jgi:hypothetical protein
MVVALLCLIDFVVDALQHCPSVCVDHSNLLSLLPCSNKVRSFVRYPCLFSVLRPAVRHRCINRVVVEFWYFRQHLVDLDSRCRASPVIQVDKQLLCG